MPVTALVNHTKSPGWEHNLYMRVREGVGGRQEEEAGGLSGVKKGEGGGVRGPENQTIWQHVSTGARAGLGGL